MNRKFNVLMIGVNQYGYHTGCYRMSENAPDDFKITYIGVSRGYTPVQSNKVDVITIPKKQSSHGLKSPALNFQSRIFKELLSHDYNIVFIKYFIGCSLFRFFFPFKKMILDIRSGSVHPNNLIRNIQDIILRIECMFFHHISIISEGLAKKLHLDKRNCFLLPLGADPILMPDKSFDSLKLIYVGTFYNRNIEKTLIGVSMFVKQYPAININYTIVGDGPENAFLRQTVNDLGLNNIVSFCGFLNRTEINKQMFVANVGISFIPITKVFSCQPPTKTFEYLAAGMPCIATETEENKKIINGQNGVLCNDDPESFSSAIYQLWENRTAYHSGTIRNSVAGYSWDKISSDFYKYLRSLEQVKE